MNNSEWISKNKINIQDISIAYSDDCDAKRIYVIGISKNKILRTYTFTEEGYPKDRGYWLDRWLNEDAS